MNLPRNGYALLNARKNGMRPQGIVLVTDSKESKADCQLIVTPGIYYDFTMLRDLDVFMIMETDYLRWKFKAYRRWMRETQNDIAKHSRNLFIIDSEIAW